MVVLGVDPGFGRLGYGILEVSGSRLEHLTHGVIETEKGMPLPERLLSINEGFEKILKEFEPDIGVVEKIYFVKSVTTALEVAHARGVVLLSFAKFGVPVVECSPQEVKISVTGYGRASKRQVQEMIRRILKLDSIPKPDDAADALAIAICGSFRGDLKW